ncbi:MAG: Arc family DNA-binding protein [Peptostreptococcaceae bacterium]
MINKDVNMRTTLTIPKDLKTQLEVLAREDHRSVNNLIISILDKHIKNELNEHNKME